jgi:hypothetical protein
VTWDRDPLSPQQAIRDAAELIGWSGVAAAAGRKERAVQKWSEPGLDRVIPVDAALAIDIACIAAGACVPPFQAWYQLHRQMAKAQASAAIEARAQRLAEAHREVGEAFAFHALASVPGAHSSIRRRVRRETAEAIMSLVRLGDGIDA